MQQGQRALIPAGWIAKAAAIASSGRLTSAKQTVPEGESARVRGHSSAMTEGTRRCKGGIELVLKSPDDSSRRKSELYVYDKRNRIQLSP